MEEVVGEAQEGQKINRALETEVEDRKIKMSQLRDEVSRLESDKAGFKQVMLLKQEEADAVRAELEVTLRQQQAQQSDQTIETLRQEVAGLRMTVVQLEKDK